MKTRSVKGTKHPSPRRRDRMIRALHRRQVREQLHLSNLNQHILPYDEPDLYHDFITKDTSQPSRFIINFPRHCVLGHVLSDSDPLNDLGPWKEVVQPTKKPRSVDPRKLKPIQTLKKTTNNKKTHQRNKKSRSVTIQIPEDHRNKNKEPRSDNTPGPKKPRSERTQNDPMSTIFNIQESRSADIDSTPQRMTSVVRHPKNTMSFRPLLKNVSIMVNPFRLA